MKTSRRCGLCHQAGHMSNRCPKNPNATVSIEVPHRVMDIALRRVRPLLRASFFAENIMETIMVSCYLQGIMDGQDVALHEAMRKNAGLQEQSRL